jgi:hypothetical protein
MDVQLSSADYSQYAAIAQHKAQEAQKYQRQAAHNYAGQSNPESHLAPLPRNTPSAALSSYFESIKPVDCFIKGKYKNTTFASVFASDPAYIRYLIFECEIRAMNEDRNNVLAYMEKKIVVPAPAPVEQF